MLSEEESKLEKINNKLNKAKAFSTQAILFTIIVINCIGGERHGGRFFLEGTRETTSSFHP